MIFAEARSIVEEMLAPLPVDSFFDAIGAEVMSSKGSADHVRAGILGPDPVKTVLSAFSTHAATLRWHAVTPLRPPPQAAPVADENAFHDVIKRYHECDCTVRIPDVVPLSPALQRFARALEVMLHQPVRALIFWSKAGAKAMVHYDESDNIIIQLSGRKRWYISTDPPGLQNNWKHVDEPLPDVSRHQVHDVGSGDLLYIPRGTPHTVDSTTESLHVAILFTPVTLRDSIIAAIDHLSDLDRSFRKSAVRHARESQDDLLRMKVAEGVERLLAHCRAPGFVSQAMEHRSSRVIGDLPPLPKAAAPVLSPASRVAQSDLSICHVLKIQDVIDFSQPGGHIGIHAGAEPALRFIADTPIFYVRDVPGLSDDVRVALVGRLIASGFLRLAD